MSQKTSQRIVSFVRVGNRQKSRTVDYATFHGVRVRLDMNDFGEKQVMRSKGRVIDQFALDIDRTLLDKDGID